MKIEKIADSHINHGTQTCIISTVTVEHEIAFHPADIINVLEEMASDSMAKVINHIGRIFNKDQFAECHAADDLDESGIQFIQDMAYFIEQNQNRRAM